MSGKDPFFRRPPSTLRKRPFSGPQLVPLEGLPISRQGSAAPIPEQEGRRTRTPDPTGHSKYSMKKNEEIDQRLRKLDALEGIVDEEDELDATVNDIISGKRKNLDFAKLLDQYVAQEKARDVAVKTPQPANDNDSEQSDDEVQGETVAARINELRHNRESRVEFVRRLEAKLQSERDDRQQLMLAINRRNMASIRAASPSVREQTAESRVLDREKKCADVQSRRKDIRKEKLDRHVAMVEKTRGKGYVIEAGGDVRDRTSDRSNRWSVQLVHFLLLESCRRALDHQQMVILQVKREARKSHFTQNVFSVCAVQRWWRAVVDKIMAKRRQKAVFIIIRTLSAVEKIPYQFQIGMHRMVQTVRGIQSRFRAVRLCREARVDRGIEKVMRRIQTEMNNCDKEIIRLRKETQKTHLQLRAAIKVRKAHFEQMLKDYDTQAKASGMRKNVLRQVARSTVARIVSDALVPMRELHDELLLDYGRKLFDKYQADGDASKLAERRNHDYSEQLKTTSILDLKVHSDHDRYLIKKMRVNKPYVNCALDDKNVSRIFPLLEEAAKQEFDANKAWELRGAGSDDDRQ